MKYLFLSLVLLLFTSFNYDVDDPYYNRKKQPSSWGIATFVKENQDILIAEYETRIDTLYDVYLWTTDLSKMSDDFTLGEFYPPDQIVITNEEKYIAYDFSDMPKSKQRITTFTDRTVKAVIFHELTHAYFNQIVTILKNQDKPVSSEYSFLRIYPNLGLRFGTTFIEEGVCEYVVYYLNESAPLGNIRIPKTVEELVNTDNYLNSVYYYSAYFLKDFLDKHGIKKGIEILVMNTPPSYEEIINPELYFNRLNY